MNRHRKTQKSWATSWMAAIAAFVALVAVGAAALHHSRAHAVHESKNGDALSTLLVQHPPATGGSPDFDRQTPAFDASVPSASDALGRPTAASRPDFEQAQAF